MIPAKDDSKVQGQIDTQMAKVVEQTVVDLHLARCEQVAKDQIGQWKTYRRSSHMVIFPPTQIEEEVVGKAVVGALMFERNACLNLINDLINEIAGKETVEPIETWLSETLEQIADRIRQRGPYTKPSTWRSAAEREEDQKAVWKAKQAGAGKYELEYRLAE